MDRFFPNIKTYRTEGFASFLVSNFDTVQESYCLGIDGALEHRLEEWKKSAQEKNGEDVGMSVNFGGERMQIRPRGTKGKSWVLENDDFIIMIGRSAKDWKVQYVTYRQGFGNTDCFRLKRVYCVVC